MRARDEDAVAPAEHAGNGHEPIAGDVRPTPLWLRQRAARAGDAGQATPPFPSWGEWLSFFLQSLFVVLIELSDDITRGFFFPRAVAPTQANAVRVMDFEQDHGFWIEPAVQRFFQHAHSLFGLPIDWSQVVLFVNSVYGISHGLVTAVVAAWIFWRRRALFAFIRNIFIFSTAMCVAIYNIFPVAPPRLATGLRFDGHHFQFVDTVFQRGGVNLSFDEYAAMPSLHIAWALIVGLALVWLARPLLVRLFGLAHPVIMGLAVVVTGNHYIADCLAAAAVVLIAVCLALVVARGHPSGPQHRT